MKKDQKYFFKRCRLCGRCFKGSVDIFSPNAKNLKELIHQCLGINVREDDSLPKKLCQFCDKKLLLWEKFKNSCENIQVKLIADSLPKKVDIPKSKKTNKFVMESKCSISSHIDTVSVGKIQINQAIKIDNCPEISQSWDSNVSVQNCVDSSIRTLGYTNKDTQSDLHNSSGAGAKDCALAVGQDERSKSKKLSNVLRNTVLIKSKDLEPKAREITDQEINDLNDTISKNLNSDKVLYSNVSEVNNNVKAEPIKPKLQNIHLSDSAKIKGKRKKSLKEHHCSICKKTFNCFRKMKIHSKVHLIGFAGKPHHNSKCKKDFQCPQCPRKLTTSFNLLHHLDTHSEACNYCCHLCGKLFRTRSSLLNHVRVHLYNDLKEGGDTSVTASGCPIKQYECQICDKKFRQSGHLSHHLKMHTGERPYKCNDCDLSFTEKYQLRNHVNAVHKSVKRYTCNVCGKQFHHTHNFRDHMLHHEGIANICCNACGKAFITNNALRRHQRLHTGEKPFGCDICGKCFADCSNRKRHRDKHLLDAKEEAEGQQGMPEMEEMTKASASPEGSNRQPSENVSPAQKNAEESHEPNHRNEEGKTYADLKSYLESGDVVSPKADVGEEDEDLILPLNSLVDARDVGLLQTVEEHANSSSNHGPLLGTGLFGEDLDLNSSESLLLIGGARVDGEDSVESPQIEDRLVWVHSETNGIQGSDMGLEGDLGSIRGGDVVLGGGIIREGDVTGILEVGMELCGDFDVSSAMELDSRKVVGLSDDFRSIGEMKEAEDNAKALDKVLCLQVF